MPSIKPLQSVVLVAVMIQSFSLMDANAREVKGAPTVVAEAAGAIDSAIPVKVDRRDAGFDTIVPANPTIDRVATGFTWVEGPIWIPDGYLLFAEITSNSIRKLTPDGTVSTFMQPSGYKGAAPYGGKEPG